MRPALIWTQVFISYQPLVENDRCQYKYLRNTKSIAHHVHKPIWTPLLDETLEVGQKDGNDHDKYAMAITRREGIVEQDKTS